MKPLARTLALLLLAAGLSACDDGRVSITVSADRPAESLQQLRVTLSGATLQREDGSEDRLELDDDAQVDLMRFNGSSFALITDEAVKDERYTGIRLDFVDSPDRDTDNYLIDNQGRQFPIEIVDADTFAPINLNVKNQGKLYTLQTRIDLRLSLSGEGDNHQLKPQLRAVRDTKAARVTGDVSNSIVSSSSCRDGRAEGVGVTVYLFEGHDAEADDFDGRDADPIATAAVTSSSSGWRYSIGTLQDGEYTVALTCQGDREDPTVDNDQDENEIDFRESHNVTLDDAEIEERDF